MASQTAKSVRLVYNGDLTESFVYGATYPRANLQQIDLQRAAEYELNSYDKVCLGFMQLNGSEDDLPHGPFQEFYAAQYLCRETFIQLVCWSQVKMENSVNSFRLSLLSSF